MTTKFVYKVEVEFPLNRDELEILLRLSASHYDGHCRRVGEVGGFLYGMKNHQTYASELPHQLCFREIDTLCKILEGWPQLKFLAANQPRWPQYAADLAARLHGYLTDINAEVTRLNH